MSNDNATLLSFYSGSNEESGVSLMDPEPSTNSDGHVSSSNAPDPTNKSRTVTISRLLFQYKL